MEKKITEDDCCGQVCNLVIYNVFLSLFLMEKSFLYGLLYRKVCMVLSSTLIHGRSIQEQGRLKSEDGRFTSTKRGEATSGRREELTSCILPAYEGRLPGFMNSKKDLKCQRLE